MAVELVVVPQKIAPVVTKYISPSFLMTMHPASKAQSLIKYKISLPLLLQSFAQLRAVKLHDQYSLLCIYCRKMGEK